MKNFYLLFLMLVSSMLLAQEGKTLLGEVNIIGAFGGPIIEVGSINGEVGADVGGGGALMINNFFIGGYGLGTDYPEIRIGEVDYNIRFKHGGLWLGYTTNPEKLVHFYSSLRMGSGKSQIRGDGPDSGSDRVFVMTPELGFEVNLTSFMRIAITGGYRVVNGVSKIPGLDNNDFSSPIGGITFRFGGFANDIGDIDWDW